MTFLKALRAALIADTALIALVPANRIYLGQVRQNSPLPAIMYTPIGGEMAHAFAVDPNIRMPRITFEVWCADLVVGEQISDTLRARLRNYKGTHTDADSSIVFQGSLLVTEPFHISEFDPKYERLIFDAEFHCYAVAV